MRIKIIGAGKIREKYLREGMDEYLKRLQPLARVEVISVPDEPIPEGGGPAQEEAVKNREGQRILKATSPGDYLVALDLRGESWSSEDLAGFLAERGLSGESSIAFLIGGSLGLSKEALSSAQRRLALGPMTFPHQMVPLILLEQIYRAFKILQGSQYHK